MFTLSSQLANYKIYTEFCCSLRKLLIVLKVLVHCRQLKHHVKSCLGARMIKIEANFSLFIREVHIVKDPGQKCKKHKINDKALRFIMIWVGVKSVRISVRSFGEVPNVLSSSYFSFKKKYYYVSLCLRTGMPASQARFSPQ